MSKATGFGLIGFIGAASSVMVLSHSDRNGDFQTGPHTVVAAVETDGGAIVERCFAPGTSDEVMASVGQSIHGLGMRFFVGGGRWPGTSGAPVSLTYSFPPDTVFIPPGVGEPGSLNVLNSNLNAAFASQGGTATWKQKFRQVFDSWEAVTGNQYTEVTDDGAAWGSVGVAGLRGDLRIGMHPIDGGSNTLAYNSLPSGGGDMVLDSSEGWAATFADFRFLRNVAMHEHGHGLGLLHVCPGQGQTGGLSKLMEPTYTGLFDGPQLDDIRGAQSLYGDRLEPNNNTGQAADLDALGLTLGVPLDVLLLSVNDIGDADFFTLNAPINATLSVIATPFGGTYLNGPQLGGGACDPGTNLNAQAQQDIKIDILNSGGGVIFTKDDNGAGMGETISNFNLGSAGVFYVRVASDADFGNVQMYNVTFSRSAQGLTGDLNNDGCVNGFDVAILLGAWGPGGTSADINGDGVVNAADLALVLGAWGAGPNC